MFDKKIIIICGHYGSGKTNIAVNLARLFSENGKKVALVDLDIVNPYFRAADNRADTSNRHSRTALARTSDNSESLQSLLCANEKTHP